MVDVIGGAQALGQAVHIVDGGEDVVHGDVVGHQVGLAGAQGVLELCLALGGLQDFSQHTVADALVDAALGLGVEVHVLLDVHHAVGDDFDFLLPHGDNSHHDAGIVHGVGHFLGDGLAGLAHQLARRGVGHRLGQHLAHQAAFQAQLLVVFIAAHTGEVVPAGVEEQAVDVGLGALDGGGLTGAQLAVNLKQRLFHGFTGIFLDGGAHPIVIAKEIQDFLVRAQAQAADEHGDGDFAVFINAHVEHVVDVVLILQPGAPVGDDGGGKQLLAGTVVIHLIVHAGGTHQRGDNDALGAVDDKGAAFGHQGEIAHKDLGLLNLASFLVQQARSHPEGGSVSGIPLLAFGHAVIGLVVKLVIHKIEHQVVVEVCNARDIVKDLFQALF